VLIDVRGTGASNPLRCNLYDASELKRSGLSVLLDTRQYSVERLEKCRDSLSRVADLRWYNTSAIVADLEDVRAYLGYEKLNVIGASFGTRAALVYLRLHPEHVRTMMLLSVNSPADHIPASFSVSSENALRGLVSECEASADCHSNFPDVLGDISRALQLARDGATVLLRDSTLGHDVRIRVTPELLTEEARRMLYNLNGAAEIPIDFHWAAAGNFEPMLRRIARGRRTADDGSIAYGLYFSLTCTEDIPATDTAAAIQNASRTLFGPTRLAQHADICRIWPKGEVPRGFYDPVRGDVPVLLVSGALDPVTPPSQAAEVARNLANALSIVVPFAGHDAGVSSSCVGGIEFSFVKLGTARGLDISCLATLERDPPFVVP
jgi:pimeloyl-ACP methyl ester carboxylesterase